jgi:hypothetical protein
MEPMIRGLPEKVWAASRKESRIARTGRHCAVTSGMSELGPQQRFRLMGLGLINFREPDRVLDQSGFFE